MRVTALSLGASGDAPMTEQQTATCPQCSRVILPEDTIVFGYGRLGHLDCRRPRVLSAEECTLALLYCHDHEVAECSTCTGRFRLRELVSQNPFGVRLHACPRCHTDLTDTIRAHLYGCAMLPAEVRRRAQEARDATRQLVKQSPQLRDKADVLIREAEAALHAVRSTLRRAPARIATGTPADRIRPRAARAATLTPEVDQTATVARSAAHDLRA
jgi:hypothetical protein